MVLPIPRILKLPSFARSGLAAAMLTITALSNPGVALAQSSTDTITAVMHSSLRVLDPIFTPSHITRNHGYMVYDTLLALDEKLEVKPQMASYAVSEDGLVYTFTLRDGLKFHDNTPVTAADAIASLKRWGQQDDGGQRIFAISASLDAVDSKTIRWTLKEPFAPLLEIVAKPAAFPAFIMPERVAQVPATELIRDYVGSGPFVFVTDEFQPGVSATYARFEGYIPREDPASGTAGGKKVMVERVRWVAMPDAQTAMNALISGEIDYIEQAPIDFLPILEGSPDITAEVRDPLGFQPFGRMNFKHPPFDNLKVRQAAMKAFGQEAFLAAIIGNPEYYSVCGAIFGCGTEFGFEDGSESLKSGPDPEGAKALLKESGYDGTPVVILQPTDVPTLAATPVVATQLLRDAGFTVDMQAMDWQTLTMRRSNQAAPSAGGWNMFFSHWTLPEILTPLSNATIAGTGEKGFFGWPTDPEIENLRQKYISASTQEQRRDIARLVQAHVLKTVNYIPLGQFVSVQARRNTLSNMLPGPIPVFWQVEKKTQ